MDASVAARPESLEELVAKRAREIAENEVRRALSDLLGRMQAAVAPAQDNGGGYLTITQAAKRLKLNENTIRRVVAIGKLPSTQKPVIGPRGTRQVLMVSASDLDAWYRSR